MDIKDIIQSFADETAEEIFGHTEFQIKNFIIGSEITAYGQYKQCLLEMRSRIKSYESILREKTLLEQREDKDAACIRQLVDYQILLEDISRELYIINDIYNDVKKKVIGKDRASLETEYWNTKFGQELELRLRLRIPIDTGLAKNILSLPNNCGTKLDFISLMKVQEQQIEHDDQKAIDNK